MKRKVFLALFVGVFSFGNLFAQKWGNTPEDSISCIQNLSMYQEFYKQQNYTDAYAPLKGAIQHCPCNGKNLYIRGVVILKYIIGQEKDAQKQSEYIDELLALYDKRISCFGEEAENKAKKAIDMMTYRNSASEEYYKLLEEAYNLEKENLEPAYAYYFFIATLEYVKAGKSDAALIIENYDKVSTILDKALRSNPKNKEEIEAYIANVEAGFSPFANCDQLIEIFQPKFNETPNDVDFLKKVTALLESTKCTNSELFFKSTENLHKLEPSPRSAYLMGRLSLDKKQYSKSVQYLKEAIPQLEGSDLYFANLLLATAYSSLEQYSNARNAAREAIKADNTKGDPYLLIAQIYALSAPDCGDTPVKRRAAYWVAVDKAIQAKNIDPSVADQANKLINTYSQYFPPQGDAFMEGFEDGKSYTVGCWIQETTTVRTIK